MALRISTHSLSSMLGRDRQGRCRWCGNRVEWFETFERSRVPLIPVEFPAARVPARYRWRVDQGIAYLGSDQGLCRIKHSSVCPMLEHDDLDPAMLTVVDSLRRNMRKLIDRGLFVPEPPPPERTEVDQPDPGVQKGSPRHVIAHVPSGEPKWVGCATDGCRNGSVARVPEGWTCYECTARAERRVRATRRLRGASDRRR